MIGVIVPAHNEEELLPACLTALKAAARDPGLGGEEVRIIAVLDACTDASDRIARDFDIHVVRSEAKNVGLARARGARDALDAGARWLAFTDADSEVPSDWLSRQLAPGTDAVCGIVSVKDWSPHPPVVKRRYLRRYQARDGHRHIHGANLGMSAEAYRRAGGFSPMAAHEDVAMVRSLEACGATVAWVASPCVVTNSRLEGRLLGGFACHLRGLAAFGRPAADPHLVGGMNLAGSSEQNPLAGTGGGEERRPSFHPEQREGTFELEWRNWQTRQT